MRTRIYLLISELLFLLPHTAVGQNTISGEVINEKSEPITGAKVIIENTYLGTYTKTDGSFEIKNIRNGFYTIIVRHQGYREERVQFELKGEGVSWKLQLKPNLQLLDEVLVNAIRADEKTPTTYSNFSQDEIESKNFGQDIPYLLTTVPSAVVSSDAGAGVGYTGIRIRGVDPTRTNVTINGIPINDSESHGVYWVNMPDFASSAQNIQVQRGVGTSSNGAAAFGASINIQSDELNKKAYGILDNGYGSFNTWRNTIKVGTGLLNEKFTVDARLSKISSDGYVDRATSDLKSLYLSGAWIGKRTSLRLNVFSGKEETYQAWYGTPESVLEGTEEDLNSYADRNYLSDKDRENLLNSGRTYNFYTYDNEVDNYQQDHYQLHFSHKFKGKLSLTSALHYTRGIGYYEQYREYDDFATYGFDTLFIETDTIANSDLIRRLWLDNHFYGGVFALNYSNKNLNLTLGGGGNQYIGKHFGEVIWAQYSSNSSIRDHYYDNQAEKLELHSYLKITQRIKKTTLFADIQYRHINYNFLGIDLVGSDLKDVDQKVSFDFANPKVGIMIDFNNRNNLYYSFAVANREPVRADFRENTPENRPKEEQLLNSELGYRFKGERLMINANVYHMYYINQLVLTGQINDVGGYTRTNVDRSYRAGLELEGGYKLCKSLSILGNISVSQNKISAFLEYIDSYTADGSYTGQQVLEHSNTNIAFSPNLIGLLGITYVPLKNFEISLINKYVGDQYLDNTSSEDRKINAYYFSNLQVGYTVKNFFFSEIKLGFIINNLFNAYYENNGYTWGYVYDGSRTDENFYYPQAGRNFMTRVTIKL